MIRETVNVEHIKQGYYSIRALNPSGIVPLGPQLAIEYQACLDGALPYEPAANWTAIRRGDIRTAQPSYRSP